MSDDIQVSLMNVVAEYYPTLKGRGKYFLFSVYVAVAVANIVCSTMLVLNLDGGSNLDYNWSPDKLKNFSYLYKNMAIDCLLLAICECIFLPCLVTVAIYSTKSNKSDPSLSERSIVASPCACFRCFYDLRSYRYKAASYTFLGGEPLLEKQQEMKDMEESPYHLLQEESVIEPLEGYEEESARRKRSNRRLDEDYLQWKKSSDAKKSFWLGLLFLISASCQVYIGLKCINFSFSNELVEGSLMGLGVLWVNIMTWTLREIIQQQTVEEGEYLPSLHPHRLHLHTSLAAHWCDLCGQQCKEGRAFRCKLCDFDLCVICHSKKDSSSSSSSFTLEGQIRGDKGVRSSSIDTARGDQYFMRALKLVYGERRLFSIGLLLLLCSNGVSLFMPSIQGSVLNAVVDSDEGQFHLWVTIYLAMCVASGLIGGLQSLCFSVVGRRLSNTIRKALYGGIIIQDVAFFDGNSSGQLTSRLTNDVSGMVQPIQSMLGTLLSNSILLLGGVALCFSCSWRLSMLAFTTVGPIVHVTQVYANWSKHLNRQIYGALASANGFATEALGNIRTVKAFSNEEHEKGKYDEANDAALWKGIRDAFGGAGMYTINSYMELGAAVLILWYLHRPGSNEGNPIVTWSLQVRRTHGDGWSGRHVSRQADHLPIVLEHAQQCLQEPAGHRHLLYSVIQCRAGAVSPFLHPTYSFHPSILPCYMTKEGVFSHGLTAGY